MKTEAAITTSSDSGKSELGPAADDSSLHSGSVVLIPKPSDDPRDPLVRQLAHLKAQSRSPQLCATQHLLIGQLLFRTGLSERSAPQ